MELIGIALMVIAIILGGFLSVLGLAFFYILQGKVEIKLTKHNIHEVVQPPKTEQDEKARKEQEEFAKEQSAFMNDAVSKFQSLFVDNVAEDDE